MRSALGEGKEANHGYGPKGVRGAGEKDSPNRAFIIIENCLLYNMRGRGETTGWTIPLVGEDKNALRPSLRFGQGKKDQRSSSRRKVRHEVELWKPQTADILYWRRGGLCPLKMFIFLLKSSLWETFSSSLWDELGSLLERVSLLETRGMESEE